jgi:CBS-domain-containing membrane protein
MEEALMAEVERTVGDLMVGSPVTVAPWQVVAHARQLMLMHSFSFLPVRIDLSWWLISELGLAKFLSVNRDTKNARLGLSIEEGKAAGMQLIELRDNDLLRTTMTVADVLQKSDVQIGPMLWLVVDEDHPDRLAGVLSPFKLM